jgi:hypothetical protein
VVVIDDEVVLVQPTLEYLGDALGRLGGGSSGVHAG